MTRLQEIRQLFDFNRWANERILDVVAGLSEEQFGRDMGSSFPSVRDTLVHVMSADWIWLERWHGVSPERGPEGWVGSDFAALRERWAEVERRRGAYLAGLTEASLDEVIRYRNLAGVAASSAVWEMLRHVVNHATYHRGQVTTMLRQLGATPPSTDLIAFYRTVAPTQG
jgi:uncharacterized damage-inducible protein DinB